MLREYGFAVVLLVAVCLFPLQATSQQSEHTGSEAKVCVAIVSNRTATSLLEERMTARLAKAISDKKFSAVAIDSRTTDNRELRPTLENSHEIKEKECDYLVLTQVSDPRDHPTELHSPQISIGGRPPSTDAADSEPLSHDNLEINFAVFRPGNPKPVVDSRILDRPSANSADSLMQTMEREGSRINHTLKKK